MISLLVAMDKNRLIGKDNLLPWHLPADLAYFKKVTMGHTIVMGRKTYESIGRPLPGRENVIVTRNPSYTIDGCEILHSIEDIKNLNVADNELFIIGGSEIFNEVLPFANRLYITEIDEEFEGDTYFPSFSLKNWTLIAKEKGVKDEKNPFDYFFCVYERHSDN